jgi:hypothetical protein
MGDWEALDETSFWLGDGGGRDIVARAQAEISDGQGLTQEQIRAEFRDPKPSA